MRKAWTSLITQMTHGAWKGPSFIAGQEISEILAINRIGPVDKALTKIRLWSKALTKDQHQRVREQGSIQPEKRGRRLQPHAAHKPAARVGGFWVKQKECIQ